MIKEIRWNKRRRFAPFLSVFVPGLGQAFTGRWGSAVTFAFLFAVPVLFVIFIPVEPNMGHYIMVPLLALAWMVNVIDAYRGTTMPTAPCMEACPARINVPHYINLIVEKRYQECHALITRWIPLVGVIGHICHHPCEFQCTRHTFDEAVAICPLKAFVGEYMIRQGLLQGAATPRSAKSGHRVAIIGSGPAGLTAGFFLARLGMNPTIFESLPVAGGMMAIGIPSYRLPRQVLQKEIAFIQETGVEIKFGVQVGADVSVEDLFGEGYRAVFAAPGTHREIFLRIEGEDKKGVIPGLSFLRSVNLGDTSSLEGRVVVIGGGNLSIDVARTALRLGAVSVTLVCLEGRIEMPAHDWEVREAEEEGVDFIFLSMPVKVLGEEGVREVEFLEITLGEPDESGWRPPKAMEGTNFTLPCDHLIPAIGLVPESNFLEEAGVELNPKGLVLTRRKKSMSRVRGLFAGGDAVTGPSSVIEASSQGRRAAMEIFSYLSGKSRYAFEDLKIGKAKSEFAARPRVAQPSREAEERLRDFQQVHRIYPEEDCLSEARRCLRCDLDI